MSKKAIVIIGLVIVAAVVLLVLRWPRETAAPEVVEYVAVHAATASVGAVDSSVLLSGKVQAENQVLIVPSVPGKVESISVSIGDRVKRNQVLFTLDRSSLVSSYDQAKAAYQAAEAGRISAVERIENAKLQLERMRELYAAGAISLADLEQVELQASETSLLAVEAQIAQAQAGVNAAEKALSDMTVRSPIEGIVTTIDVTVGNMANGATASVAVLDRVFIRAAVSEKVINLIANGQEVKVTIPSAGGEYMGVVQDLSLTADTMTGLFSLKIYLDNPGYIIKPGMFAQINLITQTRENVVAVPLTAVTYRDGRDVVYLVRDNTAIETPVVTGLENENNVEIISGLRAGDIYITTGVGFVSDGKEVKVLEELSPAAETDVTTDTENTTDAADAETESIPDAGADTAGGGA
jgi:RND family efflux transporter MFP subunit